jgi:hypothetical protein
LKYYIGLPEKNFDEQKKWLILALIHLVNKDYQSWIQKFYFKFNKSKPSAIEVRSIFSKPKRMNLSLLSGESSFFVFEISAGFFQRLIYTEDEIFSGPKSKTIFVKVDSKGKSTVVNQEVAVKNKKQLKKALRLR